MTTSHSLKRHGADPVQDATETIVGMGHSVDVDCTPEEAATFLTDFAATVQGKNSQPPIPIVIPVLNNDGSKGFVKGNFTWIISWRERFNETEGTFRMQAGDGYAGWFDVTLRGTRKVKRVKQRVFR